MVVITCPECGKELDSEVVDFESHCIAHWGVEPRRLDTLTNGEARRRYAVIMDSLKQEVE
jgi:hypothetical protein